MCVYKYGRETAQLAGAIKWERPRMRERASLLQVVAKRERDISTDAARAWASVSSVCGWLLPPGNIRLAQLILNSFFSPFFLFQQLTVTERVGNFPI